MSLLGADQRQKLTVRIRNALVATTIVASLLVGDMALLGTASVAAGETRTIQLYHVHSRESLNVTYMKNGRYVPSAMKQINRLLRDWRRNETITIDPETINLVWELHEDLGSHRPVNIVSGYRSPKTNAFLKRIGRNVAKKSQHMSGKAIDFYFPDVPTLKIRNSALVRKVGGVGYYRSSGGPTGFLHVDSGNVRHWGPAISNSQMAQAFREGSKTVGRRMRLNKGNDNTIAPEDSGNGGGLVAAIFGKKKPAPVATQQVAVAEEQTADAAAAYVGNEDDMADLAGDAAVAPTAVAPFKSGKPVTAAIVPPTPSVTKEQAAKLDAIAADAAIPDEPQVAELVPEEPLVRQGNPVPKPRLKPVEIMLMAAANIKSVRISAASGGPPDLSGNSKPSPVADGLSTVMEAASMIEEPALPQPKANQKGKGNFAAELRNGTTDDAPVIKPIMAHAGGSDINWWPQLFLNGEAAIRRDGTPAMIGTNDESSLPKAAILGDEGISSGTQTSAEGKGDLLVVNREGKGNLDGPALVLINDTQKVGQLVTE